MNRNIRALAMLALSAVILAGAVGIMSADDASAETVKIWYNNTVILQPIVTPSDENSDENSLAPTALTIDWGDDTKDTVDLGEGTWVYLGDVSVTHTYVSEGAYHIVCTPSADGIDFDVTSGSLERYVQITHSPVVTFYSNGTEYKAVTANSGRATDGTYYGNEKDGYFTSVSQPADPPYGGQVFAGWYTDDRCTERYDFSKLVKEDISLYAKWGAKPAVAVTGVSISETSMTLSKGSEAVLKATVTPADASDSSVSWTSSNPSVVSVDGSGRITAAAPGTAVITVTTNSGSKTASCTVTVSDQQQYMITFRDGDAKLHELSLSGSEAKLDYVPSKAGYRFEGWSFTEGSSDVDRRIGDDVTVPSDGLTLHAVWSEKTGLLSGAAKAVSETGMEYDTAEKAVAIAICGIGGLLCLGFTRFRMVPVLILGVAVLCVGGYAALEAFGMDVTAVFYGVI